MYKWSVVMPAYNRAAFLTRATESVLRQDGVPTGELELLVVDDGSTDETPQLMSKLVDQERHQSLKYIRINHIGEPGTVRNVALQKAQGEYVAYCDSLLGDRLIPIKIGDKVDVVTLKELFEKGSISTRQDGKEESVVVGATTLSVNPEKPCPVLDEKALPSWWTERFLSERERELYHKNRVDSYTKHRIKKNIQRSKKEEVSAEWKPIVKVIRHKTNKEIRRVDTKFGQTICTTDHSLMQWDGTKLERAIPDNFNAPCSVSVPVDTPEDLRYVFSIKGQPNEAGIIELKNHGKGSYFFAPTLEYDTNRAEAACRFLGAFVAEGSISKTQISRQASITVYDKTFINEIRGDAELFFGKKFVIHEYRARPKTKIRGRIVTRKKMKYYRITLAEPSLVNILDDLCGIGCENKKVPSFLFTAPLHLKRAFLEGLFKSDAYTFDTGNKNEDELSDSYKDKAFRFFTTSLRLGSGVSLLLSSMGIRFSVSFEDNIYKINFVEYRKNSAGKKPVITNLGQTDEYVYDIEVQDYHTFVDAMGLLVVHNSDDYWFPHHLATAAAYFKRDSSLGMVSNYWSLAQFWVDGGKVFTRIVVAPHPTWAVNTNCRVHKRSCIEKVGMFNTKKWGEDSDFFTCIENNFKCHKTGIVTSVNGYIKHGNNLTFQFDVGVRNQYF